MKTKKYTKNTRGMAFGIALVIILIFSAIMGALLKSSREKVERAKLNSKVSATEIAANANYDSLIRAIYTVVNRDIANTTNRLSFMDGSSSEDQHLRQSPEIQRLLGSNWEFQLHCMPRPQSCTAGSGYAACMNWAAKCDNQDELPLRFMLSVSQRDAEKDGFYAKVSGAFEVRKGNLNRFSSMMFALPNDPVVLTDGDHGNIGLFFAQGPGSTPDNTCRSSPGQPLQPRSIYLLPSQGQSLKVNSIATNARGGDVCYGLAMNHIWGSMWGTGMLDNYGSVENREGFIFTTNPADSLRQAILLMYNQAIHDYSYQMFNRFLQDWKYTQIKSIQMNPIAAISLEGLSDIKGSLILGPGPLPPDDPKETEHSELPIDLKAVDAILQLACSGPANCTYKLTEKLEDGSTRVKTGDITEDFALASSAPNVRVDNFTSHGPIEAGLNNFTFLTPGRIEFAASVVDITTSISATDWRQKGAYVFVSLYSTPAYIADNTRSLLNDRTMGSLRDTPPQALIDDPDLPTLKFDCSLISTASGGATGGQGKAFIELAPGLVATAGASLESPKTIGRFQFAGQQISAALPTTRRFDPDYTRPISGAHSIFSTYPLDRWQENVRFSIQSNSLTTLVEIARSSTYVNGLEALQAARDELGLH